MRVTIKQIALEAGVSVMTVSNVINKRTSKVSEQTFNKVQAIIDKYNYIPDMNARSLVAASRLIGVLFFSNEKQIDFANPFIADVLNGVVTKAKKLNYFTLVFNVFNYNDLISIQKNWRFEGLIAVGFNMNNYKELAGFFHIPTVFLDTYVDSKSLEEVRSKKIPHCFINADDQQIAYKSTVALIQSGHTNIAFLSFKNGLEVSSVIKERYAGYCQALKDYGIDSVLAKTNYFADFNKLYAVLNEFTAAVVSADMLAMKWIRYLKDKGQEVPKDFSIVSNDNCRYASLFVPALTTMDMDHYARGELAMESLYTQLSGTDCAGNLILTKAELIIRESMLNIGKANEQSGI